MKYKKHRTLVILVFCSIMAAFAIVLDKYIKIPIGNNFKITLYGLPLMFVGVMFGSIPGLIVGVVSGIVLQLTSEYGITPTSVFWALAPVAWGGVSGLISDIFKRNLNSWKIIVIVVSSSVAALLLNTLAMLMEAVIMNNPYYTAATIITGLPSRIFSCILLCFVYTGFISALYYSLKKLIKSKYDLELEYINDDESENNDDDKLENE